MDTGYIDRACFVEVNKAGSFYLVRGSKGLNPKILSAWRDDGRAVMTYVSELNTLNTLGLPLRNPQEVLSHKTVEAVANV